MVYQKVVKWAYLLAQKMANYLVGKMDCWKDCETAVQMVGQWVTKLVEMMAV